MQGRRRREVTKRIAIIVEVKVLNNPIIYGRLGMRPRLRTALDVAERKTREMRITRRRWWRRGLYTRRRREKMEEGKER